MFSYSHFEVIVGLKLHVTCELGLFLTDRAGEEVLPQSVDIRDEGELLCTLETEGVHTPKLHGFSRYLDALVADEDLFHLN